MLPFWLLIGACPHLPTARIAGSKRYDVAKVILGFVFYYSVSYLSAYE